MNRTFSIIKPDATKRNITGSINKIIEDNNFTIVAQKRIKLSKELSKRDTGKTLYILDEPTTGLHFQDIDQLLTVLHRLRDHGNTIIVIEHNLDVIKTADWIIDLGPEGGSGGGLVVGEGTPEDLAKNSNSFTGKFLRPLLDSRSK